MKTIKQYILETYEPETIKGIDAGTALNRALWTLAEKMAALKQSA